MRILLSVIVENVIDEEKYTQIHWDLKFLDPFWVCSILWTTFSFLKPQINPGKLENKWSTRIHLFGAIACNVTSQIGVSALHDNTAS